MHNISMDLQPQQNASFLLKMPNSDQCEAGFDVRITYLHSYTTNGTLDLLLMTNAQDTDIQATFKAHPEATSSACDLPSTSYLQWEHVGSFNSFNNEQVSVSNSMSFDADRAASHVKANVYGGDFHLLSIAIYC